ncbi:MAG: helix-turn-helix transcriptional regulator [Bacteroidia bacterium]
MRFLDKFSDLLYKRQKWLAPVAVFLLLCAISFRFNQSDTQWVWDGYPFIAMILTLGAILAAMIWIRIESKKTEIRIADLKVNFTGQTTDREEKINTLSEKQKEVFELISQGKSNKEIMSILSIEQSTLKTHINQLYKKLDIKSRREARLMGKTRDLSV